LGNLGNIGVIKKDIIRRGKTQLEVIKEAVLQEENYMVKEE
tara:strand:+ start:327 stop:449 length:123 start_codon:yes stop_codon:yes gene_type:complete